MKNIKKILSLTLATVFALTMTACGGSSSSGEPTEKDFEKAAEKLDGMTEEEFENAVGEGGSDKGTSDSSNSEYKPCKEILEADFTSGLVQIGDDVFKCGGYMTVGDFVEKYGDKYKPHKELNLEEDVEKATGSSFVLVFDNIQNSQLRIVACVTMGSSNAISNPIKNAIVYNVLPSSDNCLWCYYPKGTTLAQPVSKEKLDENGKETFNNFAKETIGINNLAISKTDSLGALLGSKLDSNGDLLSFGFEKRFVFQLEEENLLGYKPLIGGIFYNDSKNITEFYYFMFDLANGNTYPKNVNGTDFKSSVIYSVVDNYHLYH